MNCPTFWTDCAACPTRAACGAVSYVLALAGAKSPTAIAEWAADASDKLLVHCGATLRDPDRPYRAPSEATVRRVLQRIDGDALDAAIGDWLTARAIVSRTVCVYHVAHQTLPQTLAQAGRNVELP